MHDSSLPPFTLLIKPAGADCNLRCGYCFYLEKSKLYPDMPRHRMSDEVLERLVSSYMATLQPQYGFGWQGGEPTLMGTPFFKRVTALQQHYGAPGSLVANGLQTNGTLIDDELAAHLAAYHFLVGVSVDGPAVHHDAYRLTAGGQPTRTRAQAGIDCLRRHRVEFNILTLVNSRNGSHPEAVYRHLVDQGHFYHQYIPGVAFDADGRPLPFSVGSGQWGDFLCRLFDLWFPADTRRVSIRLFDSILVRLVDGVANVCNMGRDCRQYFLVEHNGDVYPCDFFAEPELKLGNIMKHGWAELYAAPRFRCFGALKRQWHTACDTCPWNDLCGGDCPKHRYAVSRDPRQLSYLCEGWKQFYTHTMPRFRQLADDIRRERALQAAGAPATLPSAATAGRNDPCPCGSGRKHKLCCGRRQASHRSSI